MIIMSTCIGEESDPTTFKEAIRSANSTKWKDAMEAELESMRNN